MSHVMQAPIGRRLLVGGLAALAATPAAAATRKRYSFDQKNGTLQFTARHLGILSSTGTFDDFNAELLIDPDRPLTAQVAATVRTSAIEIAYPGAVDLLRSPPSSMSKDIPRRGSPAPPRGKAAWSGSPWPGS